MRSGERVGSAGRLSPLLLLLAVVSAGTPATAQTPDISGHYAGDLTFESTGGSGNLSCGGVDLSFPAEADVQLTGERDVRIDITGAGEDEVEFTIDSSLDQELGVYTELTGFGNPGDQVFPFTGQFDVSGSQPSFTGSQRVTERCEGTFANSKVTVSIARVSGGGGQPAAGGTSTAATPAPALPPTDDLISLDLAEEAETVACATLEGECETAARYAGRWVEAMFDDVNALNLDPSSEAQTELDRLMSILAYAMELGAIRIDPLAVIPRFPRIQALLRTFSFLFIQGVAQAATGRIADLRATVSYADSLLFLAAQPDANRNWPVV